MSRDVPANKLADDTQAALVDAFARGATPRQAAKQAGCALSTAQAYQKHLAEEIAAARAELLAGDHADALDVVLSKTIGKLDEYLDDPAACPKRGANLARFLKELNHARQLRAGQPTARTENRSTKSETRRVVKVDSQGADPLRALRDRMN